MVSGVSELLLQVILNILFDDLVWDLELQYISPNMALLALGQGLVCFYSTTYSTFLAKVGTHKKKKKR